MYTRGMAVRKVGVRRGRQAKRYPIAYWSHSSLVSYLRNPLAWYKRYVLKIYDTPTSPAAVVGVAGHVAMEHFYQGFTKEQATEAGLLHIRSVPDDEINLGVAKTRAAKKARRAGMERDYLQAVGFYLARPPRHKVLGVEVSGMGSVPGLPLPVKAISDLVVESRTDPGKVDIVDHKFVESFSKSGPDKPLFMLQAIFNYYTVRELFGREPAWFHVYECKKGKNKDGKKQLRKYSIRYDESQEAFEVFHRLLRDATAEILSRRTFLPNPSDMFEGEDSFALYRLRLTESEPPARVQSRRR